MLNSNINIALKVRILQIKKAPFHFGHMEEVSEVFVMMNIHTRVQNPFNGIFFFFMNDRRIFFRCYS